MKKFNISDGADENGGHATAKPKRLLEIPKTAGSESKLTPDQNDSTGTAQAPRLPAEIQRALRRALHTTSNLRGLGQGTFRFNGNAAWEIGLNGVLGRYEDAVALRQIHLLLSRPGETIPLLSLAEVAWQNIVKNQPCSQSVGYTNLLSEYRQQLVTCGHDLEIAKKTADFRIDLLQVEMDKLAGRITECLIDQFRSSIRSSILRIGALTPCLAIHLSSGMKLGYESGYFPRTHVEWLL